ncbi:MAG: hypothetical protein M5F18_02415 [Asgard group archaeon]|nr:hypothetical protein [Asgard group archaeon]
MQRDTLTKALRYTRERNTVELLIEKYTTVAQMASNYLFNEYSIKFAKLGGYKEWQIKQWQIQQEQLSSFDDDLQNVYLKYFDSEEFVQLSEFEKKEIKLNYQSRFEETKEKDPPEFTDEFTMGDLYKILNLDYDLVFSS